MIPPTGFRILGEKTKSDGLKNAALRSDLNAV
jgi:hypothetical protein